MVAHVVDCGSRKVWPCEQTEPATVGDIRALLDYEAAAKAMANRQSGTPWEDWPQSSKTALRRMARVAVDAALGRIEEDDSDD